MCGIVGYLGNKNAVPILLDGLRHLEYRGYDSAGIAVVSNGKIHSVRRVGKVQTLANSINGSLPKATIGIAHTRWATHGEPTELNAHPHFDCTGKIALIHNGIIENHATLRSQLQQKGHRFISSTDTEVIVHLIEDMERSSDDFETAVHRALSQIEGTYGIAAVSANQPDLLIVASRGSPLVIGVSADEYFDASDRSALVSLTRHGV